MTAKWEAYRLPASLGKAQSDLSRKQGRENVCVHVHGRECVCVCVCSEGCGKCSEYCSCLAFIQSRIQLMGTYMDFKAEALTVLL